MWPNNTTTMLRRAIVQTSPAYADRYSALNAANMAMTACVVAIGLVVVCGFLPL